MTRFAELEHIPELVMAETNCAPAGRVFESTKPVAKLGPVFVTLIINRSASDTVTGFGVADIDNEISLVATTSKGLDSPVWSGETDATSRTPAAGCVTEMLPDHTPSTKVPDAVGAMLTGGSAATVIRTGPVKLVVGLPTKSRAVMVTGNGASRYCGFGMMFQVKESTVPGGASSLSSVISPTPSA